MESAFFKINSIFNPHEKQCHLRIRDSFQVMHKWRRKRDTTCSFVGNAYGKMCVLQILSFLALIIEWNMLECSHMLMLVTQVWGPIKLIHIFILHCIFNFKLILKCFYLLGPLKYLMESFDTTSKKLYLLMKFMYDTISCTLLTWK